MASFRLTSDKYPNATTVQVHPRSGRVDGAAPTSSQVTSAAMGATGIADFTGLADDTLYSAYASVSGVHTYVNFSTSTPKSKLQGSGGYTARALVTATEYAPNTERPTHVVICPEIDVDKGEEGTIAVAVGPSAGTAVLHTLRAKWATTDAGTSNVVVRLPLSFIVPAGQVYKLTTANVGGTPAFALGNAQESTL